MANEINLKEAIAEMKKVGLKISRVIMRKDKNSRLGAMEVHFDRGEEK